MHRLVVLAALAPLLAPLGGCTVAERPSEAAVLACVREAGVSGRFQVTTTLRTSGYEVLLQRGPDVSSEQAATANACISRLTAPPAAPAAAAAQAPAPPEPALAVTPAPAPPCRLEMRGGSAYACVAP